MTDPTPKLNAALVEARKEFGPLHKNAVNAFLKKQDGTPHRFADLSAILDLIDDVLLRHGVVMMQHPGGTETMAEMTTELRHVSGEMTSSTAKCPAVKADPQGYGAAYTYLRRFALEGMMGLRAVDDDGESHRKAFEARKAEKAAEKAPASAMDPKVAAKWVAAFDAAGVTVVALESMTGLKVGQFTVNEEKLLGTLLKAARAKAKSKTPDEIAQDAVKAQAEAAFKSAQASLASPVAKPSTVEANATFKALIEKIHAAPDEQTVRNIHAEGIYLKLGKGDMAALLRAVEDRIFILSELRKGPAPKPSEDLSF